MSVNITNIPGEPVRNAYGYIPTESIAITFVVLFGLSGILHFVQAIKWRLWWMIPTMVMGNLGEVIGWSGRLWSSLNPTLLDPFLMQIVTTIISPSFMSAANFTILGMIINRLGAHYSRLSPKWYLIVFITFDTAALVVQAVGGASASQAAETGRDPEPGGRIMLYGIVTQMIALSLYVILGTEFLFRYHFNKPVRRPALPVDEKSTDASIDKETLVEVRPVVDRNTKIMLAGLVINTVFLFIRTIYRTIELNDGWTGKIITNETLFNVLDGMPITVATYTFNIIHPGYLFRDKPKKTTSTV